MSVFDRSARHFCAGEGLVRIVERRRQNRMRSSAVFGMGGKELVRVCLFISGYQDVG